MIYFPFIKTLGLSVGPTKTPVQLAPGFFFGGKAVRPWRWSVISI